jgi:NAD(P)H-dependent flavin oxidoreductase YrpB (nitropropane dioxygenase family)
MSQVPQIVDAAGDVPVLAPGGIADGRQIVAYEEGNEVVVWKWKPIHS